MAEMDRNFEIRNSVDFGIWRIWLALAFVWVYMFMPYAALTNFQFTPL